MILVCKILISFLLSQIVYLGVFGLSEWGIYVIDQNENLCWEFIRWNAQNPNWLPEWWMAVEKDEKLAADFFWNDNCKNSSTENCCRSNWYRYAWRAIGVRTIPEERRAAEFIAGKKIIESHSLKPESYNLNEIVTRKEIMKVIINASNTQVQEVCREIFLDVEYDWWCKYIETALEQWYITGNQKFRPNAPLTKTEALKLIFKSRSIDKAYTTNSWQEDYISTALYLWFIDEKYWDYNKVATRGWIFSVLAKTYQNFKEY